MSEKEPLAWRDVQSGIEVESWDLIDGVKVSRLPTGPPAAQIVENQQPMKQLVFRPIPDESEDGYPDEPLEYAVLVDGEEIVRVAPDNLCFESGDLGPVWEKLGIEFTFEELETE